MTDQHEALRVADELDDLALKACGPEHLPLERVAARLLREQHAEIERLREANEALRRDAALVAAAEREECAKLADNAKKYNRHISKEISAAIRARGE